MAAKGGDDLAAQRISRAKRGANHRQLLSFVKRSAAKGIGETKREE
jgi:hypothetical protein